MTPSLSQLLRVLALLFCLSNTVVYAAAFTVTPVRSTLSLDQKISSLVVTNRDSESTVIQLEVLAWSQDADGKDVFAATKDILATPPVFTLQPNAKQVIRVGLRRPPADNRESTYRLFLTQVPQQPKPNFMGLSFNLKMSIPIFVLPKTPVDAQLNWQLQTTKEGQLTLTANNTGVAHSQIIAITLTPADAEAFAAKDVSGYMLPNQTRHWLIKDKALTVGTKVHLKVQTDKDEIETDIIVE